MDGCVHVLNASADASAARARPHRDLAAEEVSRQCLVRFQAASGQRLGGASHRVLPVEQQRGPRAGVGARRVHRELKRGGLAVGVARRLCDGRAYNRGWSRVSSADLLEIDWPCTRAATRHRRPWPPPTARPPPTAPRPTLRTSQARPPSASPAWRWRWGRRGPAVEAMCVLCACVVCVLCVCVHARACVRACVCCVRVFLARACVRRSSC